MSDNLPPAESKHLRSLPMIRFRCNLVHRLAQADKLQYFEYHPEREADVVEYCVKIMNRDYSDFSKIPAHSRWRHFDTHHPRIGPLLEKWSDTGVEKWEQCARLLDLFLVSVLLDAGAGNQWAYKAQGEDQSGGGGIYTRSEGLAIASLDMFNAGAFSSDASQPYRVDASALRTLTAETLGHHFQVSPDNPLAGLEGRALLLASLGSGLSQNTQYFEGGRPGGMLRYLESKMRDGGDYPNVDTVPISALWDVVILGLAPIWPADGNSGGRASLGGVSLGDVWRCEALAERDAGPNTDLESGGDIDWVEWKGESAGLVPFHKLSQWLTYSLVEPLELLLGWKVAGMKDMTGLPEYRNGGLLVDLGVLSLRPNRLESKFFPNKASPTIPLLPPSHPAIIEWRAMTVIELDRIADQIRNNLGNRGKHLTLPQILESATWKGGREIAKELRGDTGGGPPIEIESDGTVF